LSELLLEELFEYDSLVVFAVLGAIDELSVPLRADLKQLSQH
jgi:hypothetical protein